MADDPGDTFFHYHHQDHLDGGFAAPYHLWMR
jgi:hypothetical protein